MDYSKFLQRRRDRAIATVLSFKDRECDQYLPKDVSEDLRELILDEINDLCYAALDVIKGDVNDLYVKRLDEIQRLLEEK